MPNTVRRAYQAAVREFWVDPTEETLAVAEKRVEKVQAAHRALVAAEQQLVSLAKPVTNAAPAAAPRAAAAQPARRPAKTLVRYHQVVPRLVD
jgi:hypothetical protein